MLLSQFADALASRHSEFIDILCFETGKHRADAAREVEKSVQAIRLFAAHPNFHAGIGTEPFADATTIEAVPVGVCAAIVASNYPLNLLCRKLSPAIAAGCGVVGKPSEFTPLAAKELAEVARAAGVPDGLFSVAIGGPDIAQYLAAHPKVDMVSFTGSREAGRRVHALTVEHCKRTVMETGGGGVAIVDRGTDLQALAPAILANSFRNSGQNCYRISWIYAHADLFDSAAAILLDTIESQYRRYGSASEDRLPPMIHPALVTGCSDATKAALEGGGRLLTGGRAHDLRHENGGLHFDPTLISFDRSREIASGTEAFGPILQLCKVADLWEAVDLANRSQFGLAAYVFTQDADAARRCGSALRYGSIWLNALSSSDTGLPFGGFRQSGLGRENWLRSIEHYQEVKVVHCADLAGRKHQ